MGVILKESSIVYTKRRHDKFLGSSKYRFDDRDYSVNLKEKVKPKLPQINESAVIENDFNEDIKSYFGVDNFTHRGLISKILNSEVTKITRASKTGYILNKKKVREKCSAFFGLKESRKFLAFYTITFPVAFPDELCYQCFNTALTRLRTRAGFRSYLWVAERQKNGTLHFHMLTNNWVNILRINRYFGVAIDNLITKNDIQTDGIDYVDNKGRNKVSEKFVLEKYHGVHVDNVNNNKKALNGYLTKYVSKNDVVFHRLPYHSSRDISELFTAETFKGTHSKDFQHIQELLKRITTFVVESEWCIIEYFNQKQGDGADAKYFNPPDKWYWLRDYVNDQVYTNHHSKIQFKRFRIYDNSVKIPNGLCDIQFHKRA